MAFSPTNSVAVIGAGAAGAATAAALASENVFEVIRVFERRETPGGTWIYDPDPATPTTLFPGKLPPDVDRPLNIPENLPRATSPSSQNRFDRTPIYAELTTNVPEIAMSFSDLRFTYGPFVPHWVPKQYIQNYFSSHRTASLLVLNTTVEDVSQIPSQVHQGLNRWRLTLRKYDPERHVDTWWTEEFDAVIFANGHYSVPFVPRVQGLEEYMTKYPYHVTHSKSYRTANLYTDKRVLVIGNSASGHDITTQLIRSNKLKPPLYQSRRTKSRWDGDASPEGIEWKPVIREFRASSNEIVFEDDTVLADVDAVIYCTGYKPSFPFWNSDSNGGPIFDYSENRLLGFYQHTFSRTFPRTLGIVGIPRVLTFRSFEYQAVALARLFAGRNARPLPPVAEQKKWEEERVELVKREHRKFHDIQWDSGETMEWFRYLYDLAGLPVLEGGGRCPPVLGEETRWAIEHVRKYPEPGHSGIEGKEEEEWVVVGDGREKDSLWYI